MSETIHARIVIGELLGYIAQNNFGNMDHWVHKYQSLYSRMTELGSRNFPESTIADHIELAMRDGESRPSVN